VVLLGCNMEDGVVETWDCSTVGPSSPSRRGSVSSVGSTESRETRSSSREGSTDGGGKKRGFTIKHKVVFVTWSQSSIEDAEVFYKALLDLMPVGTEIFGCKEKHEDGSPHFHAALRFVERPNWRNALPHFHMKLADGAVDTTAIHLTLPRKYQREGDFLEGVQNYCMKEEDSVLFGTRICSESASIARKRKFQAIAEEPDLATAKKMLLEYDAFAFMKNYPAYMAYLRGEKGRGPRGGWAELKELKHEWNVPVEMEDWRRENVTDRGDGRAVPLILVGDSRLGKTEWALRVGPKPLVMSGQWNVKNYFRNFGSGKVQYWRELLGCQEFLDAHDRYTATKCIKWGFPLIVTCNRDNDPRLVPAIADYLKSAPCVVVELEERLFSVNE
jgi:hypothetical protein